MLVVPLGGRFASSESQADRFGYWDGAVVV